MPLDELHGSEMETQLRSFQSRRSPWSPPQTLRGNVVQIAAAPKFTSAFMRRAGADCYHGTASSEWASVKAARKTHLCKSKHVQERMTGNTRGNMRAAFYFSSHSDCVETCWLCFDNLTFHCIHFYSLKSQSSHTYFAVQSHLCACLC